MTYSFADMSKPGFPQLLAMWLLLLTTALAITPLWAAQSTWGKKQAIDYSEKNKISSVFIDSGKQLTINKHAKKYVWNS